MSKYYKILLIPSLFTVFILISFCSSSQSENKQEKIITAPDSLWLQFANRMKTKDIEFLVNNSLDTIQCADCNLDGNPDNEYYESKIVFENHMDKLMHINSFQNKDYYIYQDDSLMHVVYSIKNYNALEGGYNLMFNFVKKDGKYLFQGMIVTP